MKHKVLKTLLIFLGITLVVAIVVFYSMYISPENIKVTHKTIESDQISNSLHDVNVAYISDIHYGEFVDEKRFDAMIEETNKIAPDVVLFGGDLFTDADAFTNDPEKVAKITEKLAKIKAPLGKFYVLGECDLKSESGKQLVQSILYNAGFEDLTNRNLKIHNGTNDSFTLVGIDCIVSGNPDVQSAYANVSNDSFVVTFTHAPDILEQVPSESTDLALAGHTHGGQISLPIIGSLTPIEGGKQFERGTYKVKNMIIAISNGLGTTNVDMRVFSSPEVLIYRLAKK